MSGGYSSLWCGLLSAVASLVARHRLYSTRLRYLQHKGSAVVAHGLSYSVARGTFPDQGLNLRLSPALAGGLLTTGLPGKSMYIRIL